MTGGMARDTPILVGVNGLNRPAFEAFACDLAKPLPADPAAIVAWVKSCLQAVAA